MKVAPIHLAVSSLVALTLLGCQRAEPASVSPSTTRPTTAPAASQGHWNLPGSPPYLIAHYMPWYSTRNWTHWKWSGGGPSHDPNHTLPDGRRDIASVQYPLIGPYDSSSPAVIRYHLATPPAPGISAVAT